MQSKPYRHYIGTSQFILLVLMYGLALIFKDTVPQIAPRYLENILILEFQVLLFGWLLAGLFFVPMAVVNSAWLRRVILFICTLLAIGIAADYAKTYGISGSLIYLWLLFVTYGGVFLARVEFDQYGRMVAEAGFRALLYVVLFALLIQIVDLPDAVGKSWYGLDNALVFGFIYFLTSALIEYKRFFPRSVNVFFHLLKDTFVRIPKSRVKWKQGKLNAHVLKYSRVHHWWIILFCGSFLIGFASLMLYGSLQWGIWQKIITWIFFTPLWLLGIGCLLTGPWMAYRLISAGPVLLGIQEYELKSENRLYAEGYIPSYIVEDKREKIKLDLICYKVTPPATEIGMARVEKLVDENITDKTTRNTSKDGTRFNVSCRLLLPDDTEEKDGVTYIWHLQVNITETSKIISEWQVAFTLPVE